MKKFILIFIYFALTLSVLSVFWQVRNFDFINYDDNTYISDNSYVFNGLNSDGVLWAFTTGHSANWHPLTWLSLMLDCQLFGADSGKIHLINLFFHIANTLLLFAVLKKMTGSLWPSAFVAAAFAIHPMHIESVAWISERKDVLSTFFLLLTLASYIGYAKRASVFRYITTLMIFAFGLMAKPMLVTLPFVLLLLDYWPMGRFGTVKKKKTDASQKTFGFLVLEKVPFFVLAAVSSVITFFVQRRGGAVADINILSLESRIANVFLSYARYVGKMFWPRNLAVFYPYDADSFVFWQVAICILVVLAVSFFVIRLAKKQKYLFVGWFWFVGTLVPVIGLVQTGGQSIADRYTYISYIGLFIMLAWGLSELLSKWLHRKIILAISAAIVLTAMGICTHKQIGYWKNSSTLFSRALAVTENNYIAYTSLADDLRTRGEVAPAIEYYKKALQIAPSHADAVLGMGCALTNEGNLTQAAEYLKKSLQLKPNHALAHYNFGIVLQKQGRFAESLDSFAKAVQLDPGSAEAHNNLGNLLVLNGRGYEAVEQFRIAGGLKPDWYVPANNLAWLTATRYELKDYDMNGAIGLARRACELTDYRDPAVIGTLAAAYASAGKFTEAIDTVQKAMTAADAAGQPEIKGALQYHLTFYTQGKAYLEDTTEVIPDTNQP
ncbi:MAG: tetratricopeptide repeat protein [Phycisphaerae bacterium]|nr:tetratricopeptide repeat protein [Phycisphaerae bacterium]